MPISITNKTVMELSPYVPGESSIMGQKEPIKLSSNENSFGASPLAILAMENALKKSHRYPDGGSIALRKAIAEEYEINWKNIVCGAGSDEIIALLCLAYAGAGTEVLYSQYGFLMYPISAKSAGATPVKAPESNFKTDINSILSSVTDRTKIVFIANPNNPTGSYLTSDEMSYLRNELRDDILLVIDSAYAEYVTKEDYDAGIKLVKSTDNTVMIRTFSKIHGLAGLRLGWGYCPSGVADILNRVRGPFNVSSIAQAGGVAAISDRDFVKNSVEHNEKWLEIVSRELKKLGLDVYPSVANFLLVGFPEDEDKTAEKANIFLKKEGIIGRALPSYGMPDKMRFTIGKEDENLALIEALKKF